MHDTTTDISLELLDTNREPITGPIGDVQSNAFKTAIGINPLIASAMPLLSRVGEIEQLSGVTAEQLAQELQHEIKAFENAAHKNNYRSQMILAARYLLCSLLDELIEKFQPQLNWPDHSLLKFFQHETFGGERFFIILKRSFEDPAVYIDLLELGYICLSLGYHGKYQQPSELRELGLFIDQLYQIIEQQRGEHQPALTEIRHTKPSSRWRLPPWWAMVVSCGIILSTIFIPYTHQLNKAMKPLIYNINHYE
jgi:type IV/VI secretion system ImpK/VasF family protein